MIYALINFSFAGLLIWLAYFTDVRTGKQNSSNPLIVMDIVLSVACIMMGFAIMSSLAAPARLTFFICQIVVLFAGAYSLQYCLYCLHFPSYEWSTQAKVIDWILIGVSAWVIFSKFTAINITEYIGLRIEAKPLFSGRLTNYFPYTWYDLYKVVLMIGLPSLSAIIMMLRSETRTSRLDHQKVSLNAGALIAAWVCVWCINKSIVRVPMFSTMLFGSLVVAHLILIHSALQSFLYDRRFLLGLAIQIFGGFIVPALIVGFVFPLVWKMHVLTPKKFYFIMIIVIAFAYFASYQILKFLEKKGKFRSNLYAAAFENDLSLMDYSDDPEQIVKNMSDIFKRNIGISSMRILIDNGNEELESFYDEEGVSKMRLSIKLPLFDSLLNQNSQIVFRSAVENGYQFLSVKNDLLKFLNDANSDAIVLLNEGRHLLGIIVLGQKAAGNIFSDYDFEVFTKLYSYFFVFGYYMKNIGNQEIVGTVNREVHMSEQIIDSIQGNMDPIKHKKYDVGHIMIHAHNIGGEFIDLIRLNEEKHIFVMGDLSGRGISASMNMVIVKSIIRTYLYDTPDFKLLVENVNKFIRFNLPKGSFFAGIFGLIDFSDNTVYYINCGTPALFLYNRSFNNIVEIQSEGHVLGFVKDISPYIKVKKVQLKPGDILATCTDGLVDAHSLRGETFGKERIQKLITDNIGLSAQKIVEAEYTNLVEFVSRELEDNVSILVLKLLR